MELTVVIAVVGVLVILAMPRFKTTILERAAQVAVSDTQLLISSLVSAHATTSDPAPFASVTTLELAQTAKSRTNVFAVDLTAALPITHSLSSSAPGSVTLAPSNLYGQAGDTALIRLDGVGHAACLPYVLGIDKMAERLRVNTIIVKPVSSALDRTLASNACTDDDTNAVEIVFR